MASTGSPEASKVMLETLYPAWCVLSTIHMMNQFMPDVGNPLHFTIKTTSQLALVLLAGMLFIIMTGNVTCFGGPPAPR